MLLRLLLLVVLAVAFVTGRAGPCAAGDAETVSMVDADHDLEATVISTPAPVPPVRRAVLQLPNRTERAPASPEAARLFRPPRVSFDRAV